MDIGVVVADRFTIVQKLGQGGHGTLYIACDSNHRIYVLKAEEANKTRCSVKSEIKVYLALNQHFVDSPVLGIPKIFHHGTHRQDGVDYYVLVMEYLERSLCDRMIENGGTLSLKSVLMIGIQMVRILEDIHARGFVHRDIKPDNILTGLSATDCSSLFLCDFGIAKYMPFPAQSEANAACVYGTVDFASRRALESKEQGMCDDLESLGYTLMFLKHGSLPWQGIRFPPDGKQSAAVRDIYYDYLWKDLPPEMKMYFEYVKSLDAREKPDYEYLRSLLTVSLNSAGMQNDGEFEWSPPARYLTYSEEEMVVDPYQPAARNKRDNDQRQERSELSEEGRSNGALGEAREEQIREEHVRCESDEAQLPSPTAIQATSDKVGAGGSHMTTPVSTNTQACRDSRGVHARTKDRRHAFVGFVQKFFKRLFWACA